VCEAAPTARAVVICFASYIGSTRGLEFEHQREVGAVFGKVMLSQEGNATSICSVTGQHSLFRISDIRIAISPSCDGRSPRGERYGLTLFRGNDTIA
jgi:hypothetical protein